MKIIAILFIFIQVLTTAHAEITLDGSMGIVGKLLSEPNYQISAEKGKIKGNNLFHSFSKFNINTGETATFTGPERINNIISRITDNQASFIDGGLYSTIPDANLYLLNPNGIMFGPNARLNIDGSFHASTADYLRFADDQQFNTQTANSPILTTAAPEAFGFLDNQHGDININGSILAVPVGEDLSIIGGDIQIQGQDASNPGALFAIGGSLQIASAASTGEIMQSNIMDNTLTQLGNVSIQEEFFNTAEYPGKEVFIRAGNFFMNDVVIQTNADLGYGHIDIKADESLQIENSRIQTSTSQNKSGNIVLHGTQIELADDSQIINVNQGVEQAGGIIIEATDSMNITDNTSVSNIASGIGSSGDIILTTSQLQINQGSKILNNTIGAGQVGNIIIEATDSMDITDNNTSVASVASGIGNSGDIILTTSQLQINQGSQILNETNGIGQTGSIIIEATDSMDMIDNTSVSSIASGNGTSGNIILTVPKLQINNSKITNASYIEINTEQLELVNVLVLMLKKLVAVL
ncbi:filamentous hemagglutinin N-terminal domain-containing protein [Candidatus Halobeggiatoa sp. HSG11]|nr:filamentous hemagglutinin N-terminal domain-containing protein [Candidatus Halobeggiatoa sp. HSG11]